MGLSTHQQGMQKLVLELQNDPDWLSVLAEYLRRMKSGFYDKRFVEVVFQRWDGDCLFNLGDIYVFALVHSWVNTGQIAIVRLDMGMSPRNDLGFESNVEVVPRCLARLGVHSPGSSCEWSGEFWGGKQDEDGFVEWKGAAQFQISANGQSQLLQAFESDRLPLEVGDTAAAKTLLQLKTRGGVARWPYGHNEMTLLKVVNPKVFRSCLI